MNRRIEFYLKNKETPIIVEDQDPSIDRETFSKTLSNIFLNPTITIAEFGLSDIITRPSEISFIKINNILDIPKKHEQKHKRNTKVNSPQVDIDIDNSEDVITDVD